MPVGSAPPAISPPSRRLSSSPLAEPPLQSVAEPPPEEEELLPVDDPPLVGVVPLPTTPPNAFSALGSRTQGALANPFQLTKEYSITRLAASQFLSDCMSNGGRIPPMASQRRSDGDRVLRALKAMMNPHEVACLSEGKVATTLATTIAKSIVTLLLKRIKVAYELRELRVPPQLLKGTCYFNTLVVNLGDSKLNQEVCPVAFATWRNPAGSSSSEPAAVPVPESSALGKQPAVGTPEQPPPKSRRTSPRPLGSPGRDMPTSEEENT